VITVVEERDVPIGFQSTKEVGQSTEPFREFWGLALYSVSKKAIRTKSEQSLVIHCAPTTNQMTDMTFCELVLAQIGCLNTVVVQGFDDIPDLFRTFRW
jgi:hypothetical protein